MNTIFSRLEKFSESSDELLGLSLAYMGEFLQKKLEKEVLRPAKISIVHYNILSSLSVESPRPAGSIAPVVLGTPANFSAILTRMEKEGMITRESAEGDKREVLVSWTQKGKEVFQKIRPQLQAFSTAKFSEISDLQKKQMICCLQKFSEKI